MAKADIELLFGVAGGGAPSGPSGKKIQNQLNNIIGHINKNPLEIKVTPDVRDFQKQLSNLTAFAQSEAKKIHDAYQAALSGINLPPLPNSGHNNNNNGGKNRETVIKKDTAAYFNAVTRLEKLQTSVRENTRKWSEAEFGASSKEYKELVDQLTEIDRLKAKLETGTLKAKDLNIDLGKISSTAAKSANVIHQNDERQKLDADAYEKATAALKEYYKARTEAVKFQDKISYNYSTHEWETQDSNLKALVKRLNETKVAYAEAIESVKKFSVENKKAFSEEALREQQKYNESVQAQGRKDSSAADKKAKADETKAYNEATAALKEYYKAQKDAVKFGDEIYQVGDNWGTQNANLKSLVDRLNETKKAYDQAKNDANSFSDANKKLFDAAEVKEARALSEAVEAYNRSMEGSEVKEYQKQLDKVNDLLVQIKKNLKEWSSAKNGSSSVSYRGLEENARDLEEMRDNLLKTRTALDDFDDKFDEVSSSAKNFSTDIKLAGENTKSINKQIGDLLNTLGFSITYADVLRKIVEIGREMFEVVVEVDSAMTELKKVTEETGATYTRFLENAKDRAHSLGATVAETVNATADFARLGHGITDASALADAAIVYKNVGDGINDISVASESIISTMQAFGVEAKDAMSIVDSFNNVGNNFAISSKGIGDALLNSAASLHAAGNDIHESIALIAAANTTIQDPGKVGTALKTMSMYLRAAKTEAEEAGLSTENMANSVSELRGELLALTGGKVDIMSDVDAGEYKSTVDILRDLSKVWGDLSDTTKTNITELIGGGVRNANIISALMQNFSIVEDALATSQESAGSALVENEKYLDSVAGRVAQLESSLQSLSTTVLNSELVKWATSLLDILTRITDLFAGFAFDNFFSTLSTFALGSGAFKLIKDLG